MDIEKARAAFAEELRYVSNVRSDCVIAAFARVPRDRFLGDPPWQILHQSDGYRDAAPGDPTIAYHNVLFAIDAGRGLNNGHPEFWARLLDALDVEPGSTLFHVGAGLGYYTAILAELVGPAGRVIAVEVDPALAERARENLADRDNVSVVAADGTAFDPGPVDVVVVNAGATHPVPGWIAALAPGGRLLLPLTAENGRGTVFRIERSESADRLAAAAVSGVQIYPCAGAREPGAARQLGRALEAGGQRFVRSLRLDPHAVAPECWLHGDGFCFSIKPP